MTLTDKVSSAELTLEVITMLKDRVAKGAAWLDEKYPGWRAKIDCQTLDIERWFTCVLGQLEKTEFDIFSIVSEENKAHFGWAYEHGFIVPATVTANGQTVQVRSIQSCRQELNEEWKAIISGKE